jgi:epoxyqueuosine reductase
MQTWENLKKGLEERGFKAAFVSIRRIDELRIDIAKKRDSGSFDAVFYKEHLCWYDFRPPEKPMKSVIVVALPRPATRVIFRRNGKSFSYIVPPTYTDFDQSPDPASSFIEDFLAPEGFGIARALLPNKLLAVRSGLAEYGRNNITYVPGMGSYFEIVSMYSDLAGDDYDWRDPVMMKSCEKCRACAESCPTGAIDPERFLLRAERCLVFHNERAIDHPFPSWIDPSWHECPVGCMKCQRACPKNLAVAGMIEDGADFTEAETEMILAGSSLKALAKETADKSKRAGIADYLEVMPRNLSVLFNT